MKHTKKMIMVPESEYLKLLSMIKSDDFLKTEKAQADTDIKQTLDNPKISEDVKAKKYNWLYKKRRQLKHELENRPQKVIIDEGKKSNAPEVAPYLQDTTTPKKPQLISNNETNQNIMETPKATSSRDVTKRKIRTTPFKGIISRGYLKELENYLKNNAKNFGIQEDGSFEAYNKRKIKDSNFSHVIEYMTGERQSTPKGFKFLYSRISKDPLIKEMIRQTRDEINSNEESEESTSSSSEQTGSGKKMKKKVRVLVKVPPINSPGLVRKQNKFLPKIWEKL